MLKSRTPSTSQWQFWIDRGGTFTDVLARDPAGGLHTRKLLSHDPEHYEDAARHAIRGFLGVGPSQRVPDDQVQVVKMGTTLTTNALLERKGDRTVLVTTQGFADALTIADQQRPHIFARAIERPPLLHECVVEVRGRFSAEGEELAPLELDDARQGLQRAFDAGIRACAIVFMHAHRYPQHEQRVAALAQELGFTQVSCSSTVSPLERLVPRGDTTVVDAYLRPLLHRYVDTMRAELGATRLLFMQSNGGLVEACAFQAKDSLLSGPAGGIVGAAETCKRAGFDQVITFDMGGTSTDVALISGEFERSSETQIGGVRVRVPMMQIHTVAAGGGSICGYRGGRLQVGPESAGAVPGPASYRRGGPLTITDCNLLLGRLRPESFPKVFGPGANEGLDAETVHDKFRGLAEELHRDAMENAKEQPETQFSPESLAEGFLRIAVENMANAIKKISVQRGHNASEYTLCCFGGAGGQHACLVAESLGMRRVFIHRYAGVLSAYGMGLADLRWVQTRGVEAKLGLELEAALAQHYRELETLGVEHMRHQKVATEKLQVRRRLSLRYEGSDTSLELPQSPIKDLRAAFAAAHRERFGFTMPDKGLIVSAMTVEIIAASGITAEPEHKSPRKGPPQPEGYQRMYSRGKNREVEVFNREQLQPGDRLCGPLMVAESTGTTIVEDGWFAEVDATGQLILSQSQRASVSKTMTAALDPVLLEVFNNRFMAIAEQMGVTLANTAHSVNIKERLDFSCALFDRTGQLVANAPHVPVHLGSMGQSVRTIIARNPTIERGDVFLLNDPYHGGTHLPDLTVITPVFIRGQEPPQFYVAARGHHADIGGITPGSIPPHSRTLAEEGVLIDNFKLVARGEFREPALLELLGRGPWPARLPQQNLADLRAQVAANETGQRQLQQLVDQVGLPVVHAYMRHIQDNAETSVRRVIDRLDQGKFSVPMDEGATIEVSIEIDHERRSARIDFSGTSAQRPSNLNAPRSVCEAAVLYTFRCLVGEDIPLNAGCMRPITLNIPEASLLSPRYPAAVVGGNVETSQAVTDGLFAALGAMAASQGTMNNFSFGHGGQQYYETICGGAGAGPGFHGASAIQTHMTNSRMTDPEVLEGRFPVLVERFAIRGDSGGQGAFKGGDGAIRAIRFRKPMTAAILANRRLVQPFGIAGGGPGLCGRAYIERADGHTEELAHAQQVEMAAGDIFVIETPGGGGYGAS